MFGYIRINKEELKLREYKTYRSYYCGLCRCLGREYGLKSRFTLSYDALFLLILLTSLYEPTESIEKQSFRCPVHPLQNREYTHNFFTSYCAGMNLLLAYYNLQDDVLDEGGVKSRSLVYLLKRTKTKAAVKYPDQDQSISFHLHELQQMENADSKDIDALSTSFGHLLGSIFSPKEDVFASTLYSIGFNLGKYIYIIDAWSDRKDDWENHRFNPFSPEEDQKALSHHIENQLCFILSCVTENMDKLPLLLHRGILNNILYCGITAPMHKVFSPFMLSPEKEELFHGNEGSL